MTTPLIVLQPSEPDGTFSTIVQAIQSVQVRR